MDRALSKDDLLSRIMCNSDMIHKPQYRLFVMRGHSLNILLLVVVFFTLVIMTI